MKRSIVVSALVLALGVGIVEAQAGGRHAHRLGVIYRAKTVLIPPADVNFAITPCPRGTFPISASTATSGGIPLVSRQGVEPAARAVGALVINDSDLDTTELKVTATCLIGVTGITHARSLREAREGFRRDTRSLKRAMR